MSEFFLADDLSGALDAAAGFGTAGGKVTVVLGLGADARETNGAVVGVTTETRNATETQAARIVAETIARERNGGRRLRFKKIDSTLRGPIVAELQAVLTAMPEARVLFTPANPRAGRIVRHGTLLVRGTPVAETEFGRDPVWPVRESSLRALLRELPPERIVIADAETEADLAAAVDRMEAKGGDWVGVGSGALARIVAQAQVRKASRAATAAKIPLLPAGPTVMICGSAHPANRAQADQLRRDRGVPLCDVRMDNGAIVAQHGLAALRAGGGASLVVEPTRVESAAILRLVASVATQTIVGASVRRSFITGGETAFAVCTALGIKTLDFVREIEPGVCLATALVRGNLSLIAIKPGGFGDAETWVRVWDALNA